MNSLNEEVNSQQFIETQCDHLDIQYLHFCEVRSGARVPFTSTQKRVCPNRLTPLSSEEESIEFEIIKDIEAEPKQTSKWTQTEETEYVTVEKNVLHKVLQAVENIEKSQKALMKEFVELRDNRLNVRYLVDTENQKFCVPFDDIETFTNFDANLIEVREAVKQLKSLFMKQDGHDLKKFIKTNLKNLFTDHLANRFTFSGRQRNLAAKKFNAIKILKDCTLEKFPNTTENTFNTFTTNYFYYIKDRHGKLKRSSETSH